MDREELKKHLEEMFSFKLNEIEEHRKKINAIPEDIRSIIVDIGFDVMLQNKVKDKKYVNAIMGLAEYVGSLTLTVQKLESEIESMKAIYKAKD